ncbi:MAG: xylulose kinase [Planctomycetes bacterium]|nr:xylulose kinase [Planctomycetota bacterium]
MLQSLRCVPANAIITGWDFSTSGVKCLAFDINGATIADVRLPTDLWTKGGVSELNLLQLEGQARGSTRGIADALRRQGRLADWIAGGISATHHTSGRIDAQRNQVRRAICWNDQSLAKYHAIGLKRLGGQKRVRELIGGPWAIRYSLSHLVKDERKLANTDWQRTARILSHGSLAAGYLTGNFDVTSISCAASTGLMDFRSCQWCQPMLDAIDCPDFRELAWQHLPNIIDQFEPIGPVQASLVQEAGLASAPMIFPTSDDQQAGLIGGGAVDAGQMAVILGTSAVVNSSSAQLPETNDLDVMRLNWGPYLWMRCYTNGAGFLNKIVGDAPDWAALESAARNVPPGCGKTMVAPFLAAEPSIGVNKPFFRWAPKQPKDDGVRFRAALEALAYLIALGVQQHKASGQTITRITVSGGIAKSALMCEILASVLDQPLELLVSDEGPALGAAVTALAAMENHLRKQRGESADYSVADAVAQMVKFRGSVAPNPEWTATYAKGLRKFAKFVGVGKKGK